MKETPCLTEIQHKQLSLYLVHLKRVGTRHASNLWKVEWWIRKQMTWVLLKVRSHKGRSENHPSVKGSVRELLDMKI